MKTIEERKAILDIQIIKEQKDGWLLINRTNTLAQFTKIYKANTGIGILLCLLFLLPGILYFYSAKKTKTILIDINENGELASYNHEFLSQDPYLLPTEKQISL